MSSTRACTASVLRMFPRRRACPSATCGFPFRPEMFVRFIGWLNSIHKFAFDLLQRFAFGFRQLEIDEDKAGEANARIEPEGTGRTKPRFEERRNLNKKFLERTVNFSNAGIQNGKSERQNETRNPQGRNGHSHGRATDSVRKNF